MKRLYAWLLYLFPRSYRLTYGDELQAVINLSFAEARSKGILSMVGLVLREVISLPGAILYEHLRERSRMSRKFMSHFDLAPGSWKEILAGMAPFLLFGAVPAFEYLFNTVTLPRLLGIAFVLILWFSIIGLYAIGFARQIPRWFLVYLGFPLPLIGLWIFTTLVDPDWRGFPFLYRSSWYIRQFVQQGLMWGIFILLVLLLLVVLSMAIPGLRSFYRRIRTDWTILCFFLYGAMPFLIVFLFDEYKDEELFLVLSFLALAGGTWLYLLSEHLLTKFLSLFGGMTLAMLSTVLGQSLLYESSFPFTSFPEWTTTMSTAITWIWFTLFMLLPLMINLLPRVDRVEKTGIHPMPENT